VAVRVGLPTSHGATKGDACSKACWTGIRTVPISDSAITSATFIEDAYRRAVSGALASLDGQADAD
jgi:hypothetical protein